MRIIFVKNVSGSTQTWIKEFTNNEEYQLQNTAEREMYATSAELLTAIGNGDALIGDGDGYTFSIPEQMDWLINEAVSATSLAFDGTISGINANNFYPCPDMFYTTVNSGEANSIHIDSDGNLVTRGPCFTDEGSFRDDFSGSSLSTNLTGTCSFTNGGYTVTGVGTSFLSEINLDYHIKLSTDGDTYYAKVLTLVSDTELELAEPYGGTTGDGTGIRVAWHPTTGTGGSISVANSECVIASGTTANSETYISRDIDYGPMRFLARFKMSQRISNHTGELGYKDDVASPQKTAYFLFDGTSNTTVKCISSSSSAAADTETTTVTIPNSGVSSGYHDFYIDVQMDQIAFYIDKTQVALHTGHLPGPYDVMSLFVRSKNGSSVPASSTSLSTEFLSTLNINQVECQNTFNASPIFTAVQEDVHPITAEITTNSTTADQVILSLTVPANKTLYIIGYSVATSNIGGTVKIGKNTVTTVPAGPGTIDSNIFRTFKTADWGVSSTARETEDFGGNPRRLGYAGDVVKITVTPKGTGTSIWSATLDYVLR